ncbi:hypothetical protein STCU_00721 [Strigomonas culicis]|uniref:Sulfatase N-terminal domain-containing protein n=1 Tax=Strigomonas culicis TaxID=28005 RepID=S9V5S4_9TRYP|nr:hypothetical protein STCU_00721 [Strigomonas culicis]|eukprot:EPY36168.1 hypothetical protein STCU_00721 [Strigomonas culicis]
MTTAASYPSLAHRVKSVSKGVVAFGTSSLLNAIGTTTGACTQPGVLDMECATKTDSTDSDAVAATGGVTLDCFATSTCNLDDRLARVPTNPTYYTDGTTEARFTRQLRSVFGGLAYLTSTQESALQDTVADNLDGSLFVFHFDQLARRAESTDLPDFQYSASSAPYTGQAYLLDALIGEVTAYLRDRAKAQKENWLVIGVSDHGGSGKSHATGGKADTAIPFFLGTYTASAKGYTKLKPLVHTTSQLDVLPTALRWLDIAPFDNATQAVIDGTNTTYSATVDAQVAARQVFEGKIQGICSSGTYATDCTS